MNRQIMECNFLDDTAQEDVCAMGNYLRNKYTEGIFKTKGCCCQFYDDFFP